MKRRHEAKKSYLTGWDKNDSVEFTGQLLCEVRFDLKSVFGLFPKEVFYRRQNPNENLVNLPEGEKLDI